MKLSVAVVCILLVHGLGAIPAPSQDQRIINGIDAVDNQRPYEVSLNFQQDDGHTCGASIIAPNWLLTAAHCCGPEYPMYVYAGSVVLSKGGKRYDMAEMLIHGNYDPGHDYRNDVCLIKIYDQFDLDDGTITQVTLAGPNFQVDSGDDVEICGWGYTTPERAQVVPDRMMCGTDYKAITNEECGKTGVNMFGGFLCVQPPKTQGACNGDSGSPLMLDDVQIGVASWIIPLCGSGHPDFYARVSYYYNWIITNMGSDAKFLKFA